MASHSTVARSGTSRPNRLAATAATAALTLAFVVISPGPWTLPLLLLFASVTWAMALVTARGETPPTNATVVALVPLAFAGLMALIAFAGMSASWFGIDIWSTPTKATLLWIVVITVPVALSWKRRSSIQFVGQDQPAAVILGTTMLVGVALAVTVPIQVLARNVSAGTDFGRHLSEQLKPVSEAGQLSYASSGYPRGLHALVSSALPKFSSGTYEDGWIALEATAWLLIALSATALAVAAGRAAMSANLTSWFWQYAAAIATVVIFLQGAVIDSFLFGGFVTSLLAVLVICAAVSTALGDPNSRSQDLQFGLLTVAMSQAWQLLVPLVVAPLVFLWIRALLTRQEAGRITLVCGVTAALTLPAFLPLIRAYLPASNSEGGSGGPVSGLAATIATEGNAGLDWPGWWWLVVIPLVVTTIVVLWRRGARFRVLLWLTMTLAAIVLVVGLWLLARDANTLPYFILKSLWSALPILLPVTVVGAALATAALFRLPDRWPDPVARIARPVIVALLVIGAMTGVGGQWAGDRPTALQLADGLGGVAYQLQAISSLEQNPAEFNEGDSVLVWGFVPSSGLSFLELSAAGFADVKILESLPWLQAGLVVPNKYALNRRDTEAICQYLGDNPETVRITGPNPQPGAQWLLDSGCPKDVVRPGEWQVIEIDESWFEGREELLPYSYPSWSEAQEVFG
jgi:hypothetical protein